MTEAVVAGAHDASNSPALPTEEGGDEIESDNESESEIGDLSAAILRIWDHRWVLALSGATLAVTLLLFIAEYVMEERKEGAAAEVWQQLEGGLLGKADRQLPVFAFLITGRSGQVGSMRRLLYAVYHPRNEYLLHFDGAASPGAHAAVAQFVRDERAFAEAGNVRVVTRPNAVTYKGASMTTTTLHGLALLLRQRPDWDWFLNLSANDYPLVTPDDLLHVFSSLPRHLNFVQHSVDQMELMQIRTQRLALDSQFSSGAKKLVRVPYNRSTPTSFRFFKGSAWVVLSRAFSEYTIFGYDNLPRTLLLYLANSVSSPEHYFQTLLCNSRDFNASAVNSDLRYIKWEGGQHPVSLLTAHFPLFVNNGGAFARKFAKGSGNVLKKIDEELLHRNESRFVRGGWCVGSSAGGADPCDVRGDLAVLNITNNAKRLAARVLASLKVPKCMLLFKLLRRNPTSR